MSADAPSAAPEDYDAEKLGDRMAYYVRRHGLSGCSDDEFEFCRWLDGVRQMEARAEKAEAEYGHLNELYAHVEKHNAELSAALERVRDAMRCPDDFATCPTCLERIREAVDGPSAKPENGQ